MMSDPNGNWVSLVAANEAIYEAVTKRERELRDEAYRDLVAKKACRRRKLIRASVAVLCVVLVTTLSMWCKGFNFDHRGDELGGWFVVTLMLSAIAFGVAYRYYSD